MNSGFGNFGLEMPTWDFDAPTFPDYNFDLVKFEAEAGEAKKERGAALANSILDLVAGGIGMYSSLQQRKGAEAAAQVAIANAAAAGQISQHQAQLAQAQVSVQLGLAKSEADVKKAMQKTILYSVLAVVVVGGVLGGIALARK